MNAFTRTLLSAPSRFFNKDVFCMVIMAIALLTIVMIIGFGLALPGHRHG